MHIEPIIRLRSFTRILAKYMDLPGLYFILFYRGTFNRHEFTPSSNAFYFTTREMSKKGKKEKKVKQQKNKEQKFVIEPQQESSELRPRLQIDITRIISSSLS